MNSEAILSINTDWSHNSFVIFNGNACLYFIKFYALCVNLIVDELELNNNWAIFVKFSAILALF